VCRTLKLAGEKIRVCRFESLRIEGEGGKERISRSVEERAERRVFDVCRTLLWLVSREARVLRIEGEAVKDRTRQGRTRRQARTSRVLRIEGEGPKEAGVQDFTK